MNKKLLIVAAVLLAAGTVLLGVGAVIDRGRNFLGLRLGLHVDLRSLLRRFNNRRGRAVIVGNLGKFGFYRFLNAAFLCDIQAAQPRRESLAQRLHKGDFANHRGGLAAPLYVGLAIPLAATVFH